MRSLVGGFGLALGLAGIAAAQPGNQAVLDALWADMNSDVVLGHPQLTMRWGWGFDTDKPPTIVLEGLACKGGRIELRCDFRLRRTPHAEATDAEDLAQPRVLHCTAQLKRQKAGDWQVVRHPPRPQGGHSRTTLTCRNPIDPPAE